jgi:MFS family permease
MTQSDATATGSPLRNIGLLAVAQAVIGSNQAVFGVVASLTALTMVKDTSLSTLPVAFMTVGTALATGPSAYLIYRLGRRGGFMLGAALAVPGALLAALAAWLGNFWLLCATLAVLGATSAFANQYRFAAADSVPANLKARAISWVMAGGVVSGFVGPNMYVLTKDLIPGGSFVGTYVAMAVMALIAVAVLSQTRLAPVVRRATGGSAGRSFKQLLSTFEVIVPMVGGAASFGLMVMVMVAAPIAMVTVCGHTTTDAAYAIQWHIVSMFAPSFITGSIIHRMGAHLTASIGLLLIIAAAAVNLTGTEVYHFVISLILLGVGWNFGFIASTALLSTAYRPDEASKVQGLNEQVVFGVMALASILSGVLLNAIGWQSINVLAIPVATLAILTLAWGGMGRGSAVKKPA